jgi:hypothetical protein
MLNEIFRNLNLTVEEQTKLLEHLKKEDQSANDDLGSDNDSYHSAKSCS